MLEKDLINKLKEIETLVELSIGQKMTEEKATEIYSITNELMCDIKKNYSDNLENKLETLTSFLTWYWREVDGKPYDTMAEEIIENYI